MQLLVVFLQKKLEIENKLCEVDSFGEKLLTLMDNPLLLKEFSNKAFEKSKDFLEENVIKKWIDILL